MVIHLNTRSAQRSSQFFWARNRLYQLYLTNSPSTHRSSLPPPPSELMNRFTPISTSVYSKRSTAASTRIPEASMRNTSRRRNCQLRRSRLLMGKPAGCRQPLDRVSTTSVSECFSRLALGVSFQVPPRRARDVLRFPESAASRLWLHTQAGPFLAPYRASKHDGKYR